MVCVCVNQVLASRYLEDAGQLAHMECRSAETAAEYDRLCSSSAALETVFLEPDDSVSHMQRYAQVQEFRGSSSFRISRTSNRIASFVSSQVWDYGAAIMGRNCTEAACYGRSHGTQLALTGVERSLTRPCKLASVSMAPDRKRVGTQKRNTVDNTAGSSSASGARTKQLLKCTIYILV